MDEMARVATPPNAPDDAEWLASVLRGLASAQGREQRITVLRDAARRFTGADGATIVLREGDHVYYADESAIGPLWKGRRFPAHACLSGWVMLNREPAVIDDVYRDPRVAVDLYRPTFVRSLILVPVGRGEPVAAIGAYWAEAWRPGAREREVLARLADAAALALSQPDGGAQRQPDGGALPCDHAARARESAADAREGAVDLREGAVARREASAGSREAALSASEPQLVDRALQARGEAAAERERSAEAREAAARVREEALRIREQAFRMREDAVRAREQARAALRESESARAQTIDVRDQLIGFVSHDLKNPLAAILAAMEIVLRRARLHPEDAKVVRRAVSSAHRMDRIVQQLLDYTRLRIDGAVPLDRTQVSVNAVCRRVIDELEVAHARVRVRFCEDDLVIGGFDEDRLAEIFSNVIGNACQYAPDQSEVQVSLRREDGDVVIAVHNPGEPIPDDLLPYIFEPFRGNDSNTRSTGLGLFITQQLVHAHGGAIRVVSRPDEGTSFTIRLPLIGAGM